MARLESLLTLRENVYQNGKRLFECRDADMDHSANEAWRLLLEDMDADLREVRADVEQLIETGEF